MRARITTLAAASSRTAKLYGVEIVAAGLGEGDVLRELHVATWAVTYRDRLPRGWYRERLAAHRARDWGEIVRCRTAGGGGVLTARCVNRMVGLCEYGPSEDGDEDPGRVGHIHRLYVDPARQRTGIGRSLLTASTDRLRESGMSAATLWVLERDERARSFYERVGWKPDGKRKSEPMTDAITDLRYRVVLV
jgi:ribosomal protein S18 acetylase RimI-like enzyme